MEEKTAVLFGCLLACYMLTGIFSCTQKETIVDDDYVPGEVLGNDEYKIIYSHVIFRHGDRAPATSYKTSPHGEKVWRRGLNELTNKGMKEQFLLGKYLRKRYSNLLSKQFFHKEIYVRSTDKTRTLQSAAANLAALFPPTGDQIWNKDIKWQPVPIHTVPLQEDYSLITKQPCEKYKQIQEKDKLKIKKYNEKYETFFAYVEERSGNKIDFDSVIKVQDPLFCEHTHGLELDPWTQQLFDEKTGKKVEAGERVETAMTTFDLLQHLRTAAMNLEYDTDEKARLTAGYLLGEILERLEKVSNGTDSATKIEATKMMMYSAHDISIMPLLYAMKVIGPEEGQMKGPLKTPYAAAVFIDLYQDGDNEHFVEVNFKKETLVVRRCRGYNCKRASKSESKLIKFKIPGCPETKCPLKTFIDSLESMKLYPKDKLLEACRVTQATAAQSRKLNDSHAIGPANDESVEVDGSNRRN